MLEIAKQIDLFFMGKSPVHETMPRLAAALREINVPFACAGAMTTTHRPRDFDDVIQLIRINELTPEYAERLNPTVRAKSVELWPAAQVREDY